MFQGQPTSDSQEPTWTLGSHRSSCLLSPLPADLKISCTLTSRRKVFSHPAMNFPSHHMALPVLRGPLPFWSPCGLLPSQEALQSSIPKTDARTKAWPRTDVCAQRQRSPAHQLTLEPRTRAQAFGWTAVVHAALARAWRSMYFLKEPPAGKSDSKPKYHGPGRRFGRVTVPSCTNPLPSATYVCFLLPVSPSLRKTLQDSSVLDSSRTCHLSLFILRYMGYLS